MHNDSSFYGDRSIKYNRSRICVPIPIPDINPWDPPIREPILRGDQIHDMADFARFCEILSKKNMWKNLS